MHLKKNNNDTKLTTMSKRIIGRRNEQLNLLICDKNIISNNDECQGALIEMSF